MTVQRTDDMIAKAGVSRGKCEAMRKSRKRVVAATYWWAGRDPDGWERDGVSHVADLTLTDWVENRFIEGWRELQVRSGPAADAKVVGGIGVDGKRGRRWWARDKAIGTHTIGFESLELAQGEPGHDWP